MGSLVVRRLLQLVPVLVVASVVVWGMVYLIPGDPALVRLGPNATPAQIAHARTTLGLDEPIFVQYAKWLGNAVTGDFGESFVNARPVTALIGDRLPVTAFLTVGGLLVGLLIGVPLGVVAGSRPRSRVAALVAAYGSVALALPTFWVGILLVLLLSVVWRVLPSSGYVPLAQDPGEWARHMVLPVVTLGFYGSGIIARFVASAVSAELRENYVWTARAKGVGELAVITRHALRNALIPLVTVLGLQVGLLLGGAVVIEAVFNLPGMGRLLLDSVIKRDYVVVQAEVLFVLVCFALINLVVDLAYGALDPRIRT